MKTQTNIQKINHLMTMYPGDSLTQAFVIEAVRRYAAEVVDAGMPADNPRAIISPAAWYATAAAIANQLDHWREDYWSSREET
jgi:hypothetical protein